MPRFPARILSIGLALVTATSATADPAACRTVRFSDVGWTDISATTAVAANILKSIGYATKTQILSGPVTYASMGSRNIDALLGNWMPTMEADRKPYLEQGKIEVLGPNLTGAKYTLAVPDYLYDQGLRAFADITKFRQALKGRIYGIEPGNDGNRTILEIIARNTYGLASFNLVESSEQGMLAQVERSIQRKEPILFLGWEPHPMNTKFPIKYLAGGDDTFGPHYGGAEIFTNLRVGYSQECPNLGRFFRKLAFDLPTENAVMGKILFDGMLPEKAAALWLKDNPGALTRWLDGIETFDGKPALPAARAALSH